MPKNAYTLQEAKYNPQTLMILVELRKKAGLSQDEAAACLGLTGKRRRLSVGNWEAGYSRPSVGRRSRFIPYLLDDLDLRHDPQRFLEIWRNVMVDEWRMGELSDTELRRHLPGHAAQIIAGQHKAEPDPALTAQPSLLTPPPSASLPQIGVFVGRQEELAQHGQALLDSHLAVITGMPGVGKTTLATVLARQHVKQRHASPDHHIFWHSFRSGEDANTLIWQMASFLYRRGQQTPWQMLQNAQAAADLQPSPHLLLDYLLESLAGRNYLLCLDDFHHVDGDALVQRLAREAPQRQIPLIITSRRTPSFTPSLDHQPLGGLTWPDVRHLLSAYHLSLSDDLAATLHERTKGNAKLLMLAIDALRHAEDPARLIARLTETDDIERFLLAEVDAELRADERAVMQAVAVLMGHPGARSVIEHILNGESALRALRSLSDRHLLAVSSDEDGQGERTYTQHALLQTFYYRLLSQRERRAMHRRAGQYYAGQESDGLQAALHLEQAGELEPAARLAVDNVWGVINQGRALELGQLLGRFTSQQLEQALWAAVVLARGEVYRFLREGALAKESYQEAIALLTTFPGSPAVCEQIARACRGMGELLAHESLAEALNWLHRGLNCLSDVNSQEKAALHIRIGHVQIDMNDFAAALEALERGLELLPAEPSPWRAVALNNLGIAHCSQGRVVEGMACYRQALAISQQLHDYRHIGAILMNLGIEADIIGDWEEAAQRHQEALDIAQQLGNVQQQVAVRLAQGILSTRRGDDDLAAGYLKECIERARRHHLPGDLAAGLASLADLHLQRDGPEAAQPLLQEAERLAQAMKARDQLPEIWRGLALVHLAQGRPEAALSQAEQSVALARELERDRQEGMGRRVLSLALLAAGRQEEALAAFEDSFGLLRSRDPYEAARTGAQWGRALVVSGDAEQGPALLQEARATFRRLGARRDLAALPRLS